MIIEANSLTADSLLVFCIRNKIINSPGRKGIQGVFYDSLY